MHTVRTRAVEKFLNGGSDEYDGPKISENISSLFLQYGKGLKRAWGVTRREFKTMAYGNVQLPHNIIFMTCCVLYTLTCFDIIDL